MIDIDNQTDLSIPQEMITNIHQHLSADREMELLVVDNATMRQINASQRGIDNPTDVLSFPFDENPLGHLGSLVISADYVRSGAREFGHKEEEEFCLLFIHGLLHLLGYDHECDHGEMRAKEAELIAHFALPSSLIIRNSEF